MVNWVEVGKRSHSIKNEERGNTVLIYCDVLIGEERGVGRKVVAIVVIFG